MDAMNEISPLLVKLSHLIAQSHMTFSMFMEQFYGKCVSIIVYEQIVLSDKKCILLKYVHILYAHFFNYAQLGISIQHFSYIPKCA